MPKERTYVWIIALLLVMIVFVQITGHLSLMNGAIQNLFNVLSSITPNEHSISAQYIHLIITIPFKILRWLGANEFKYYAYAYSFIITLIPFLPLLYFAMKKNRDDCTFVIPLIGISLIFAVLDLNLFSEWILGITLFNIFMGAIHYSETRMSLFEKVFMVAITPLVGLTGWSSLVLAPIVWSFAWMKKSKANNLFLLILCAGMLPGMIYSIILIFQSDVNRKFILETFTSNLIIKNLSFAIGSHFVLLCSLFYALVTKNELKALVLGLSLAFFLNWFDWTLSTYIRQIHQAGNLLLVSFTIGIISLIGFLKIKKMSLSYFYPSLVLCLLISLFTQSYRKMTIANYLNGLYEVCSRIDNKYKVKESLLVDTYSDISKIPYLSRSACLLRNEAPKTIINIDGNSVPVKPGQMDHLLPNIDKFISTEILVVTK